MKFLYSIVALTAAFTALAQSASEAILGYGDHFGGDVDSTAGWTFQPAKPLTVTELGCFAKVFNYNPDVTSIQVGLWDDNGSLLASNSITPGSVLFDLTRYEPIPPVSLQSGQVYHLGVYCPDRRIGLDICGAVAGGSVSASAEIQLGDLALGDAGFAFPDELAGTDDSFFAGPNFMFQSQPRLAIQLAAGHQVRLSWPTAFQGYTLQSKPSLSGTWGDAGLSVTTVGSEFVAFDTSGPGPTYYRLIK